MKRMIVTLALAALLAALLAEPVQAIPAFARKYKMSCKTCHLPFPRLKPYGEDFAGDGFQLKDQEASRAVTETGDEHLSLIRDFPIAIRMDGFFTSNNSNSETIDMATPYNIKLLSGGTLAKNISYYFYFFFSERGEIVGLEDAFIAFSNVFNTGVSVTVGQFQVSDPLFKREVRLTYEDYQIYKTRPGGSGVDLTYDRGVMLNYSIPGGGPDLSLEVINGTGIDPANAFKNFDNDSYKNLFLRASQDIGEYFRLGAHYYMGREKPDSVMNEISMWGADGSVSFGDFGFNFQFMSRKDSNPVFDGYDPTEMKTSGGFAECVYTPGGADSVWYFVGLFNWVNAHESLKDYQSFAVHAGYLLKRNIRIMAELDYLRKSALGRHARLVLGLIAAF